MREIFAGDDFRGILARDDFEEEDEDKDDDFEEEDVVLLDLLTPA